MVYDNENRTILCTFIAKQFNLAVNHRLNMHLLSPPSPRYDIPPLVHKIPHVSRNISVMMCSMSAKMDG